jgi:hypothetical protein
MNAPVVRHPRRLGFVAFNLVMAVAAVALVIFLTGNNATGDVGALPNSLLAVGALIVLGIVWLGTWLAWGAMVWRRRVRASG